MLFTKKTHRLFFLGCCIFLMQSFSYSQNSNLQRDSLRNIINTANDDTNKVNALVDLGMDLVQYEINEAKKYALQAIDLSDKIKFYKGKAKAHLVLSRINRETSDYSEALTQTFAALKICEEHKNQSGSAKCFYELGYIYKDILDFPKAIENFTKALSIYKSEHNELNMAFCQTLLGHVNADLLNNKKDSVYFKRALGYYRDVLNYYTNLNKPKRVAVALLNLSNLYLVYNRIWSSDFHLNKSLEFSEKSLELTKGQEDDLRTGINLENIGEVYFVRKKYKEALDYYFQAKAHLDKNGNKDYILENLFCIIKIYKEIGQYNKALELCKDYVEIAKPLNYKSSLRDYYQILSEIYFIIHKNEEGLDARMKYENYKDSVLNEEKTNELLKLQVEYQTDQKDKEITLLNKDKDLIESKISRQQLLRNFLIAFIILVLALFGLLYNRYRIKLKTNQLIEDKNKELQQLSIVVRETANGVFITDANGEIEWFNEGFFTLFGWKSLEDYAQKRGNNIYKVSTNPEIKNIINECVSKKKSVVYENDTPDKNGNLLWVKTTLTPIFDEKGKLKKMVFIETDVSELKKAKETAEKSLHIQEQFLANTSHEIRTPMNGVLGMTRQLLETPLNKEQEEYVNAIKESSNNLLHVVNDILDISKIRSGKIVFEMSEFRIVDLFKSLQFMLQYKAEEKNIIIDSSIDSKIPPVLMGDAVRLNQILINLAGNAIKFTESGRISFTAEFVGNEVDFVRVKFCVVDTGIGIPESKLDLIFETFAQAETHTTRKYGGTGLGLSISKILVEELGGQITVNSKEGLGSSFCFDLKFKTGDPQWQGPIQHHTEGLPDKIDLSDVNILLVEDNVINQRVALFELNKWRIKTDTVDNANAAFDKLKTKRYDLVLMDISMPGLDGVEATKFIRADFQEMVKHIPIVAMTASALTGEKERCLAAGMNDYISKPFNPVTLYKKIVKWTKKIDQELFVEEKALATFKRHKLTDLSIISEYASGNVEYIKEMIETFVESMPDYLVELNEMFEQKKWEDLKKQAHKMKTPSAYFGLEKLRTILSDIETISNIDESILKEQMKTINSTIEEAIIELKHELNKIS